MTNLALAPVLSVLSVWLNRIHWTLAPAFPQGGEVGGGAGQLRGIRLHTGSVGGRIGGMALVLGIGATQLTESQAWVFIGLGVMGLIYLFVVRPMMRRKDPLERAPDFASVSRQRDVERQMQSLLVELSEMSRQITAQLDTRAAKLEILLKEADEKIAQLKAACGGAAQASLEKHSSEPISAQEQPDDPRHADVYALADQGRDVGEIAVQLGRPRGEVELILALRSR